jgi:hypothetical protein
MQHTEEFSRQRAGTGWLRPAYRRAESTAPQAGTGPRFSRIRYAYSGAEAGTGVQGRAGDGTAEDDADRDQAADAWLGEVSPGRRRTDSWVLVGGGIAAAAAFAAAFLAAGGAAAHPAAPSATVPAVVSQACPSAAP